MDRQPGMRENTREWGMRENAREWGMRENGREWGMRKMGKAGESGGKNSWDKDREGERATEKDVVIKEGRRREIER